MKNVNGIYVINLDARTERWAAFEQQAGLWVEAFGCQPQRFSAVAGVNLPGYDERPWFRGRISDRRKRSWAGKAGCILSHRNIIEKAAKQGWDNVLIVEDDAFLTDESVKKWLDGLQTLVGQIGQDWAAIYLCTGQPITPCRKVAEFGGVRLLEAAGAFGTVAYMVNRPAFDGLLKELPRENSVWPWVARYKTIDRWFSQNMVRIGKVYVVSPSIVGHECGPSDITMTAEANWSIDFGHKGIALTSGRQLFKGKRMIRRVDNALRRCFSSFRLVVKRMRGL